MTRGPLGRDWALPVSWDEYCLLTSFMVSHSLLKNIKLDLTIFSNFLISSNGIRDC